MSVMKAMLGIVILACCPALAASQTIDHSLYAALLSKYVDDGWVNYQGFQAEEAILDQYFQLLEKTNSAELSRSEQFAFYINAYNAWTIKLILSKYPDIQSIKKLGTLLQTPWQNPICRIDGKLLSLDDIEHGILRPRFKDPRVHMAVNYSAKSCPKLRSEPYVAERIDEQLDDAARAFVNDRRFNTLRGDTLYVNRIFNWYAKDFNNGIFGFFLKYARGDLARSLASRAKVRIEYLPFDWYLNDR